MCYIKHYFGYIRTWNLIQYNWKMTQPILLKEKDLSISFLLELEKYTSYVWHVPYFKNNLLSLVLIRQGTIIPQLSDLATSMK
jgi:hypothetical protein